MAAWRSAFTGLATNAIRGQHSCDNRGLSAIWVVCLDNELVVEFRIPYIVLDWQVLRMEDCILEAFTEVLEISDTRQCVPV